MGPSVSRATNRVEDAIKQSITDIMSQKVNAAATATCSNIQSVDSSQCCKIVFSEQTCEAVAINEVISTGQFDRTAVQDTQQAIENSAKASNEGLYIGLASVSSTSNVIRRTTNLAIDTKQIFETECSKEVTGLNAQTVKDANCGCGTESAEARGVDIQFAAQTTSLSATGNCVATAVGSSTNAQTLAQMTRNYSEASTEGVDLFGMFLAMIGPLMIFIIAPIGFKILTKPHPKNPNPSPAETQLRTQTSISYALVLLLVLVITIYALCAIFLGWPPNATPSRYLDVFVCTPEGQTRDKSLVINQFMWYDRECLSKPSSCTEEDKIVAYQTCGLMSKVGGCDDAQFLQDKADLITAQRLCLDVSVLTTLNKTCTAGDLADTLFISQGYGGQCRRCFSNDPGLAKVNGLYARLDPEQWNIKTQQGKPECNPATGNPAESCYLPCDKIDPASYFAGADGCPATLKPGVTCYTNKEDFDADADRRNECDDETYMKAKANFANLNQSCSDLMQEYTRKFPGSSLSTPLAQVCEPDPFRYLDCNPTNFMCNYTGSSPAQDLFCKNDFSLCNDSEYLADKAIEDAANDSCFQMKQKQEQFEKNLKQIPIYFGAVLLLILIVLVWSMRAQGKAAQVAAERSEQYRTQVRQNDQMAFTEKLGNAAFSGVSGFLFNSVPVILIIFGILFLNVEKWKNKALGIGLAAGGGVWLVFNMYVLANRAKKKKQASKK